MRLAAAMIEQTLDQYDAKVIPGHGGVGTKVEVARYLDVLRGTFAAVQAGVDQGKSLDQLRQEHVLAKWEYLNTRVMNTDAYLERLYRSSTSQKNGSSKNRSE